MTTIRQIHVDSRHSLAGGTAQKFDITIPGGSIEIGSHMAAMISDVHLANVFPTIVLDQNDRLYWEEIPATGQATQQKAVQLDPGAYTALSLAVEVQRILNANTSMVAGFDLATPQVAANPWVVTYNSNDAVLEVKNQEVHTSASPPVLLNQGSVTRFYTQAELKTMTTYAGSAFNPLYARDCCEVIGRHLASAQGVQAQDTVLKFQQIVDVSPTKSLYLHSPNLDASRGSLGPRGERTVLCKIPLTVPFGAYQYHQIQTGFLNFDVSNQEFGVLSFYVTTTAGDIPDFRGTHLSFTIVLFEKAVM